MHSLHLREYSLKLDRTLIMGVLNVTPDSFSDGGKFWDVNNAVAHAKQMVQEGADMIDIGGESSRPGSEPVSEKEEWERVQPIIEKLLQEIRVPLSIDTYKPYVAKKCLEMGVHMLNDINGLRDKAMIALAAQYEVPAIIMHMQGKPKSMQENPTYSNVVEEVKTFLTQQVKKAKAAGVKELIIDPGIGFGKTTQHNLQLLKHLHAFKELNCPILVGVSRKTFIGNITGLPISERLPGSIAAMAVAIMNGANMVRVHDVYACKKAAQVIDAVQHA